jgi:hypothetical protein
LETDPVVINILHIWEPGFKNNFGGQYIYWKYAYNHWDDNRVCHKILDYDGYEIKEARSLIHEINGSQHKYPNRFKRIIWAIHLVWFILRNKNKYDFLHIHIWLWVGVLISVMAKWMGKPTIYESVLEGVDNPSVLRSNLSGKIFLWGLRHFNKILAISNALADDYKKFQFPVVAIPNAVDTSLFSPANSSSA